MNAGMVGLTGWRIAESLAERYDYGRSAAIDQIEFVRGEAPVFRV
jgi:hypothetical protein